MNKIKFSNPLELQLLATLFNLLLQSKTQITDSHTDHSDCNHADGIFFSESVDNKIGLNIISAITQNVANVKLAQDNHTDHTDGHSDTCHVDSGDYSDCYSR